MHEAPPVRFSVATAADDADLRRMVRAFASGGSIRLALSKEPSFFDALEVEGRHPRMLIGRDAVTGVLGGGGSVVEKPCYVNGEVQPVGYLSGLRIARPYRGGGSLREGFERMRELCAQGQARLHLTTIVAGNERARRALAVPHPGIPRYRPAGTLTTFVFTTHRNPWRAALPEGVRLRRATDGDAEAVAAFLQREGRTRQFFPHYTAEDLRAETGLLRGLSLGDVVLAEEGGEVVGTAGLWDQRPFRQWVVEGYSRWVGLARPLYNLFATVTGRPRLPPPGTTADARFLALPCVRGDDPALIEAMLAALWPATGGWVVAVAHERSRLWAVLRRRPHLAFQSWVYVVHWDDAAAAYDALGDGVPTVEGGSL